LLFPKFYHIFQEQFSNYFGNFAKQQFEFKFGATPLRCTWLPSNPGYVPPINYWLLLGEVFRAEKRCTSRIRPAVMLCSAAFHHFAHFSTLLLCVLHSLLRFYDDF